MRGSDDVLLKGSRAEVSGDLLVEAETIRAGLAGFWTGDEMLTRAIERFTTSY